MRTEKKKEKAKKGRDRNKIEIRKAKCNTST